MRYSDAPVGLPDGIPPLRPEPRPAWGPGLGMNLLAEAALVLGRVEERLDHLGPLEVAAELFELREPEVEAREVRVRRVVRVSSEIPEVLHQHEGSVELALPEGGVLDDLAQHLPPRHSGDAETVHKVVALALRQRAAGVGVQLVDELRRAERV